jgi:hypothetical protein
VTGTTAAARRSRPAALGRRRNSRLDWVLLRWQARLDARWADRVVPWAVAGLLFVVLFTAALGRAHRLDAGADLARAIQAAWFLGDGSSPEVTIGEDVNYFALQFPVAFIPIAAVVRFLPAAGTLLALQSASLALGVVPLWHLARKVAQLRVGAAAALVLVYGLHPALADLALGDFHTTTMAMTPLMVAAYAAERCRWARFGAFSAAAVACSSELGIVVATMGLLLVLRGDRRPGGLAIAGGLGWTTAALLAVQGPLGTGLVGAGAFTDYGDTALEVLIEVLRNPLRPIGDLLVEENVQVVVAILAPLLFLPVLALRRLMGALPLQALYLIGDVPVTGPAGGGRTVPLLAFAFVAAPFALARLGRQSIERVNVDRRLLTLLAVAGIAAAVAASPLGPFGDAFARSRPGDADLRAALEAVPDEVAVRAPEALSPELAERHRVEILEPGEVDPTAMTAGVGAVVVDESTFADLDDHGRFLLRRRVEDRGFVLVERSGDVNVFVRR